MRKSLVSLLGGFPMVCTFGVANAAFQSCIGPNADTSSTYNIADNVTASFDCTILKPLNASGGNNDNVGGAPSGYTVNQQAFFGINDWLFNGKWDNLSASGGTDTSSLYNFSGNNLSGSFIYTGPLAGIGDILFVFKDGNDTNLVGYRMTVGANGTYTSPFEEPPFSFTGDSPRTISHISVYFRGTGVPPTLIPEPGSLALLGLGLCALTVVARRRS